MADDTRNFIEQSQSRAELATGSTLAPDDMAREFAKLSPSERVDHLDRLNSESTGELSVTQAANMLPYMNALRGTHERLRKIDR